MEVQQISHETTALSTHINQCLTVSKHKQGQSIEALTKCIEIFEQQPGPRKQCKLEPQQQQPQQPHILQPTTTPTQLPQKPTPQHSFQTEIDMHSQTHQKHLHNMYRDPMWGTSDTENPCTKCHHPQMDHVTQTCPVCQQQTVHKCLPGYID